MQNKKDIPVVGGAYSLLRAKLLKLVQTWPEKNLVITDNQLDTLCIAATDFKLANATIPPQWLVGIYQSAPDLVLAILTTARKQWNNLDKTQSGRVRKFVATNSHFKPWGNAKERFWCNVGKMPGASDGEVALAFEEATGEEVSTDIVVKARKAVAAEIELGFKLRERMKRRGGKKSKKASV